MSDLEQVCATIGHEAYHRSTFAGKGLIKHIWIDECLAYRTSLVLLNQLGFANYAAGLQRYFTKPTVTDDAAEFAGLRRRSFLNRRSSPDKKDGFAKWVSQVGIGIHELVGWKSFTAIASAANWNSWLNQLPNDVAGDVTRLFAAAKIIDSFLVEESGLEAFASFDASKPSERVAKAYYRMGWHERSIAEYRLVVDNGKATADGHLFLGRSLDAVGQNEEAIQEWIRAVQIDSDCKAAYGDIAATMRDMGRLEEAITWYEKALRLKSDDPVTHFYIGKAFEALGNTDQARLHWETVLNLGPSSMNEKAVQALNALEHDPTHVRLS